MFTVFSRFAVVVGTLCCASAQAQHNHRHQHNHNHNQPTSHHHHDAMGHRIDDRGHHIDLYGRHTGAVGVYDNGAASYRSYPRYGGYWNSGVSLYASPVMSTGISPVVPMTTYPATVSLQPNNAILMNRPPQNALPVSNGGPYGTGGKIVIRNPADSGGEVRYQLNGMDYTIGRGYSQTIENDRVWVITFGSGGSRGDVRYTLGPGQFQFRATQNGWDLAQSTEAATAPNSLPPAPSPAVFPDQSLTIPPLSP